MRKILGIDLGTTNSVVAVMEGGSASVIKNLEGHRLTPSVVSYDKNGNCLVGSVAQRQSLRYPQNTYYSVKRLIGRKYEECVADIRDKSFKIIKGRDDSPRFVCPQLGKSFLPEDISARLLHKLADDASQYIGEVATDVVITVPAYFNEKQRRATEAAGQKAGLHVVRLLNEPTAAALYYGVQKCRSETVLVFDLGGGTLDISILKCDRGNFEVLSTTGDTQLGGNDFDTALLGLMKREFYSQEGIDLDKSNLGEEQRAVAFQRLYDGAEQLKKDLSVMEEADLLIPYICAGHSLDLVVSRKQFNSLSQQLVERCRIPLINAIKDTGLHPSQIDKVVLAGGSTRMPCIKNLIRNTLNREPESTVNPDEVVASGAAIYAGVLSGELNLTISDVTAQSLGISTNRGKMTVIIPRNTKIPTRKTRQISTAQDSQSSAPIRVYQGENKSAYDNTLLHEFRLEGIPPAPKGVPKIQVIYEINESGTLRVVAENKDTGARRLADIRLTQILEEVKLAIRDFPPRERKEAQKIIQDIEKEATKVDRKSNDGMLQLAKRLMKMASAVNTGFNLIEILIDSISLEE